MREVPLGEQEIKRERVRHEISVVTVTPALTLEQIQEMSSSGEAIVLIAFASGTIPQRLAGAIKEKVDAGVPVFLVSSNEVDDHGILKPEKYAVNIPTLEAGVTPIQRLNSKDMDRILECINLQLDNGIRGQELAEAVSDELSYKDGEEIPKAEWDKD